MRTRRRRKSRGHRGGQLGEAGSVKRHSKRFAWRVADDDGGDLITIDGTSNEDFAYGLGTGYAGSYHYIGRFRDAPITGTGYIEWIDRR